MPIRSGIPGALSANTSCAAYVDFPGGAVDVTDGGVFVTFPGGTLEVTDDNVVVDVPGFLLDLTHHGCRSYGPGVSPWRRSSRRFGSVGRSCCRALPQFLDCRAVAWSDHQRCLEVSFGRVRFSTG